MTLSTTPAQGMGPNYHWLHGLSQINLLHCTEAEARLMAAAPELLEALKITRGNIASLGPAGALTPYTSYQEWLAMVDAAIAKATGGQNEQD